MKYRDGILWVCITWISDYRGPYWGTIVLTLDSGYSQNQDPASRQGCGVIPLFRRGADDTRMREYVLRLHMESQKIAGMRAIESRCPVPCRYHALQSYADAVQAVSTSTCGSSGMPTGTMSGPTSPDGAASEAPPTDLTCSRQVSVDDRLWFMWPVCADCTPELPPTSTLMPAKFYGWQSVGVEGTSHSKVRGPVAGTAVEMVDYVPACAC